MAYTLPELPYSYDALEPHMDARTMEIHYSKHHQGYLDKLNAALAGYEELFDKSIEELLKDLSSLPEQIRGKVKNAGGGYYHHSIWWQMMKPNGGGDPTGDLVEKINEVFGSFEKMKEEFNAAAGSVFGSGWTWLVKDKEGNLSIISTANQDSPISDGYMPLLGIDVWEHAYYLKYQNRRPEFIEAFWNVVNWDYANEIYSK